MASKSNILMFGATGAIGKYIISAIVEAKESFGRIAIFTSTNTVETKLEQIEALRQKGVEIITGNITNDDHVKKAYEDFDTVVCALGRDAIAPQIRLIELADESPTVKRFLPSEYGTDIEYGPESATEKPHQQKLKVRAAMKKVKNLEYAYVVTGPYADHPFYVSVIKAAPQLGSFNAQAKKAVLLGDGKGQISLSTCSDVGKFVVCTLTHWDVARNRALKVNSFTTTPEEILAEFEKQMGAKWEVEYTPLAQLQQIEQKLWEKGSPAATVSTLRRIWTQGGTLYKKWDNEDIGAVPTETLSEVVAKSIKAQLAA